MKSPATRTVLRPLRTSAFSLLEMLVGMGMLSLIVLALFSLFNQTQKALLANVSQSDVMENGRSILDLLVRDLVRARSAGIGTNFIFRPGTTNVQEEINPAPNLVVLRTEAGIANAVAKQLFVDGWRRDSLMHDLFYLAQLQPGHWTGAGLFVSDEDPRFPDYGLGTLYRYEDGQPVNLRGARAADRVWDLYNRFFGMPGIGLNYRLSPTNSSRLIDGVVFFRVTPFGTLGEALDPTLWAQTNIFPIPPEVLIGPDTRIPYNLKATQFRGRAFPSALEVELGILPAELLERYRALPRTPDSIRARFLTNNAANILVFRQRIPMVTSPAIP